MDKTIWIDVLTPKQAMLLGSIAARLLNKEFNVVVTARDYDYTQAVLKTLGLSFTSIGGYADNLLEKLFSEIERMKGVLEILGDRFDLAIAYPNPVVARTAFGLGKTYIALTDSPHSEIVSRLSLPLAKYVIFSRCIPTTAIEQYVYKRDTLLIQYDGVDEVEWLKDIKPDISYIKSLNLEPYSYIVARPPEVKASYYRYGYVVDIFRHIISKILELELKLVYLPRYREDPLAMDLKSAKNVYIPSTTQGIVGYHVVYYALATVTGGGTLAREAALLGTPGISLFPEELYVDKCLQELGLPIVRCRTSEECLGAIRSSIRNPEEFKSHSQSVLKLLEKPSDALLRILSERW